MKTRLLLSATALMLSLAACQKENIDTAFAPEPQDEIAQRSEPSKCLSPETLKAANTTGTKAELTWNAVYGISGYKLEIAPANRNAEQETRVFATEGNRITMKGLHPATTYRYRVSSVCSNGGFSSPSVWMEFYSGQAAQGDYPVISFENLEIDQNQ
mgnify:CR=1 FL=1|jgi:chitodextrinase